jgi:XTP/dITP diphosphohydrolase
MGNLLYVTGNKKKFENAKDLMSSFGIYINRVALDIPEIQDESPEAVTVDKAKKAWESLKKPLFVNDASWIIPALNGFPGPYMKYINKWFVPQDFINLMSGKENRQVILRDTVVYVDGNVTKAFSHDTFGTILEKTKGSGKHPSESVTSLSSNGLSVAEENEKGSFFLESEKKVWEDFAGWLRRESK